jgi:hypothetical protein
MLRPPHDAGAHGPAVVAFRAAAVVMVGTMASRASKSSMVAGQSTAAARTRHARIFAIEERRDRFVWDGDEDDACRFQRHYYSIIRQGRPERYRQMC